MKNWFLTIYSLFLIIAFILCILLLPIILYGLAFVYTENDFSLISTFSIRDLFTILSIIVIYITSLVSIVISYKSITKLIDTKKNSPSDIIKSYSFIINLLIILLIMKLYNIF